MATSQGTPGVPRTWKRQEGSSPKPQRGRGPLDTLIPDFQASRPGTSKLLLFSAPSCGALSSRASWETHTGWCSRHTVGLNKQRVSRCSRNDGTGRDRRGGSLGLSNFARGSLLLAVCSAPLGFVEQLLRLVGRRPDPGGPQLVGYRARLQGPTASGVTGTDLRDQWLVRVQGQTPGDPR